MERILCPVDLKPDTLNALEAAALLAAAHKAQLMLLHILTQEEYEEALRSGKGELKEIDALQYAQNIALENLCDTLRQSVPGLNCISKLRFGNTIDLILNEAREFRSNLIVMGSHGVSDIAQAMDGNHPVKVIEQSVCPVLCVPNEVNFTPPSKVVYGSRIKKEDPDCIQKLLTILHPFGCRIEVVYVGEESASAKQKWQAHEALIRSYVPYDKMRFTYFRWQEEAYQGLDEFMNQSRADMLVLLTHQRNFLQRLFEKSVFKQITYFSDYPFLVFLEDHLVSAEY